MVLLLIFFLACFALAVEECQGKSDIMFVFDGSGSIDYLEFDYLQSFATQLVSGLTIGTENLMFGSFQFAGSCSGCCTESEALSYHCVRLEGQLSGSESYIKREINNAIQMGGGTPLDYGLKAAHQYFKNKYSGQTTPRSDVQKFIIVLTDGRTNGPSCDTYASSAFLVDGGIVIGLTVGNGVDRTHMETAVSSDPAFYTHASSFSSLNSVIDFIASVTCLDLFDVSSVLTNDISATDCTDGSSPLQVTLLGFGFVPITKWHMLCRFTVVDSSLPGKVSTYNAVYVSNTELNCEYIISGNAAFAEALQNVKDGLEAGGTEQFIEIEVDVSLNNGKLWTPALSFYVHHNCSNNDYSNQDCLQDFSEGCTGSTDIIFVLDSSQSVNEIEFSQLAEFVLDVAMQLCIDEERQKMGMVLFTDGCGGDGNDASLELSLTSDRTKMVKNTKNLNRCGNGQTPLHSGLAMALQDLRNEKRNKTQSFVVIVSDGATDSCVGISGKYASACSNCVNGDTSRIETCLSVGCCTEDFAQKTLLESEGALVFGIAVGSTDEEVEFMKNYISSYPSLFASASSFSDMKDVKEMIVSKTCLDVYRIDPSNACTTEDVEITVYGTGFFDVDILCRLTYGVGDYRVYKGRYEKVDEENDFIVCPIPWDEDDAPPTETPMDLEVSINNGYAYSSGKKTLVFYDCNSNASHVTECVCYGASDIVFVMDSSYSIDNDEWEILREFSYNVSKKMCIGNETSHISLVQFTTGLTGCDVEKGEMAYTWFNLTGDRKETLKTMYNLGRCGMGQTPLHYGLELAYNEIVTNGRPYAYKYVIVLTDGVTDSCRGLNVANTTDDYSECKPKYEDCYNNVASNFYCYQGIEECCGEDLRWVDAITNKGAFIYSIAVGTGEEGDEVDVEYLKNKIASHTDFFAHATSFGELEQLLDGLVDSTCVDIFFMQPEVVCKETKESTVSIFGTGFVDLGEGSLLCKMYVNYNEYVINAIYESDVEIICPFEWDVIMDYRKNPGKVDYDDADYDFEEENQSESSDWKYPVSVSVGGYFYSRQIIYEIGDCPDATTWPRWIPITSGSIAMVVLCALLILGIILLISLIVLKKKKGAGKVERTELDVIEQGPVEALPEPEPEPEPSAFVPAQNVQKKNYYLGGRANTIDWSQNDGAKYGNKPKTPDNSYGDQIMKRKQMREKRNRY